MRQKYRIRQVDAGITPDEFASRLAKAIHILKMEDLKYEQRVEKIEERGAQAQQAPATK
jgi:hypothetical protein